MGKTERGAKKLTCFSKNKNQKLKSFYSRIENLQDTFYAFVKIPTKHVIFILECIER